MNVGVARAWGPEDVAAAFNVSHETLERLQTFVALLTKWQVSFNLIGPGTMDDIWGRHIADSLQLVAMAPGETKIWIDLGSGGGLPGVPIAIMLAGRPGFVMHLVESSTKKCAFLTTVRRKTGAPITIHNRRIEALGQMADRPRAEVLSARALAPLPALMDLAAPFVWKNTVCLFPKGQDVERELTEVARFRRLNTIRYPSRVDASGSVLRIEGFTGEQYGKE